LVELRIWFKFLLFSFIDQLIKSKHSKQKTVKDSTPCI
jgi:hypothetical protein